jgi:serine/threonine-protein kinase
VFGGEAKRLKEFVVAVEVFDGYENYDPNIDSIVRVESRRSGPGSGDPILIGLRPGSYVPIFRSLASHQIPAPVASAIPSAKYTTVAVLPFVNRSSELEQDYFCDGIADEILNALAAIANRRLSRADVGISVQGQACLAAATGGRSTPQACRTPPYGRFEQ